MLTVILTQSWCSEKLVNLNYSLISLLQSLRIPQPQVKIPEAPCLPYPLQGPSPLPHSPPPLHTQVLGEGKSTHGDSTPCLTLCEAFSANSVSYHREGSSPYLIFQTRKWRLREVKRPPPTNLSRLVSASPRTGAQVSTKPNCMCFFQYLTFPGELRAGRIRASIPGSGTCWMSSQVGSRWRRVNHQEPARQPGLQRVGLPACTCHLGQPRGRPGLQLCCHRTLNRLPNSFVPVSSTVKVR